MSWRGATASRLSKSQNFPLIGATIGLFRITDSRPADEVRREFAADASVRSVQFNFRYLLQDQKASRPRAIPRNTRCAKLRLPQAHTLAHGMNVTIAVIDSGIDVKHPELANAIADSFDALGSKEGPHVHGTGIAGAIVAHARLMGSAPAGQDFGDPRLRRGAGRRGKYDLRDPQGAGLRRRCMARRSSI